MKENKYNVNKILKELDKKHFVRIDEICDECLLNLISIIVYTYPYAHLDYDFNMADTGLYTLRVSI